MLQLTTTHKIRSLTGYHKMTTSLLHEVIVSYTSTPDILYLSKYCYPLHNSTVLSMLNMCFYNHFPVSSIRRFIFVTQITHTAQQSTKSLSLFTVPKLDYCIGIILLCFLLKCRASKWTISLSSMKNQPNSQENIHTSNLSSSQR